MHNFTAQLTNTEQNQLKNALHYMKMAELKAACLKLGLPSTGNKAFLIAQIMSFVQTGKINSAPKIPAQSMAKYQPFQNLSSTSLMLYGDYKNDLNRRNFFKTLIGPHFHFTAFGIDWLNDRWLAGQPPTYQEFADYWVSEYTQRKLIQAPPKAEWAFINFVQQMQKTQPNSSKTAILNAWKQTQTQQANLAKLLLAKV